MEISKTFDPTEAEKNRYATWEGAGYFSPEINENPDAEPFSIVIPPPNVTGTLHMGHALQHTLMDTLTRWKRMRGFKTLFLVGVDHAGISTQLMVTRQLKRDEHKRPQEIGREAFVERVWKWKLKYGGEITRQIRREGLSVDWTRERFTMDEDLSKAVREVFVRLFEEGLIYRGTRIVNWCPKDMTVLSDLEVREERSNDGKLYFLKYPVKESERTITVATTRPETMLGDTAVAVNPLDDRFRDLIGKTVVLPLAGREIPIIGDEYVDPEFGTGAVKITPAHDANDWEIGERHNLEKLVIMNPDASMNDAAGSGFAGLDRAEARIRVVEEFDRLGLLDKIEDYEITLPRCERCKTVIEPLLSEQWFVRMESLRDLALNAVAQNDAPKFFPEVPHKKVYVNWLENMKDWTISRQLWWGHQIPAWYDKAGNVFVARSFDEARRAAGTDELRQDEDVLDTWFSSALWPFSTLGWTGSGDTTSDLEMFYPTDVIVTGRDILFLWVSRMVMMGLKFVGEKPFDHVIIHGTVLDRNGQRMSKTKGNGIDPLDVFNKYGVDATRMTLAGSATGVDFAWRDERVESFRNFANKIWNAARFCLLNSDGAKVDVESLRLLDAQGGRVPASLADRWIISRLNRTSIAVNYAFNTYQFHEAVQVLYHFFWDDFCDWYIELVKDEISGAEIDESKIKARSRIVTVLEHALRLLHPIMPYLTEELWQKLPGASAALHNGAYRSAASSIMLADFPKGDDALIDETAERQMSLLIDVITKVRNIRSELNINTGERLAIHIAASGESMRIIADGKAQIQKLARAGKIILAERLDVPKASARAVVAGGAEIAVPLEGLIDFDKERSRLEGHIAKLVSEDERINGQLSNANFVNRAPVEKVDELRRRRQEIQDQTAALTLSLNALN